MQRAHDRAAGRRDPERERRERRRWRRAPPRPAPAGRRDRRQPASRAGAAGRPTALEPRSPTEEGRRGELPGGEMGGDDRPGRGPDERLAFAQVDPGAVLDPRQDPHHPRLAEHATAAEHEDVGAGAHRSAAYWAAAPALAAKRQTVVRDNVQAMAVTDSHLTSPVALGARVRALREAMDLSLRDLAERSGVSAPMLSQVERGETSPTLQIGAPDRRMGWSCGSPSCCGSTRRVRSSSCAPASGAAARSAGGGGHAYEILTPPLPGQRAELSRHTLAARRGHRRPRRPADARAGQPRDRARRSAGTVVLHCDGAAPRAARRRLRDLRRRPAPPLREPSADDEAVLLAVVSAGLRRS